MKFFGLIRAVQEGRRSVSSVSPDVASAAMRMVPKDSRAVSPTKHKGLKDSVQTKQAGSGVDSIRRIARDVTAARRQALEKQVADLRTIATKAQQENVKLQQEKVQAAATAGQAQAEAQAQLGAQAPVPPPAQVPYGRFLTGQQDQEDGNKGK